MQALIVYLLLNVDLSMCMYYKRDRLDFNTCYILGVFEFVCL